MIRVGVIGASGRMGSEVCRTVEAETDLELVARVTHADTLEDLFASDAEVAVEFTTPGSVHENVRACVSNGLHVVVGATGLTDGQVEELGGLAEAKGVGVFVAPNFALGAVLMMHFAQQAARFYDWAEIVERHHERKLDAPSGTAKRTADLMGAARKTPWATDLHIHSLRLPGSVAHQEVIFGGAGETLTIKHDSLDHASFMPGVVLAIRSVSQMRGVTVGLENVLDLS